jgi:TPR repeat protein
MRAASSILLVLVLGSPAGATGDAPTPGEQAVEAAFAPARAGCERGDAASCERLAQRLDFLTNDREARRLAATLSRACAAKVPIACAGQAVTVARGIGLPADVGRGLALLRASCDEGQALACGHLAEIYVKGELGVKGKREEGLRLAAASCKKLGGWPCMSATAKLDAKADAARILALATQACDGGDAIACYELGKAYAEHVAGGPKADPTRATALYRKACDQGYADACFNLAGQVLRGTGATQDERAGRALLERSCTLGDGSACDDLAEREGKPEVYCDLWGVEACLTVLERIGQQRGETADTAPEIVSVAARACRRGSTAGCEGLGHLAQDYASRCKASVDVRDACTFAGLIALENAAGAKAGSPDSTRALADAFSALGRACDKGSAPACAARKRLAP